MELVLSSAVFNVVESIIVFMVFTFLNQINDFFYKNRLKSIIFIFMYALLLSFADYFIPHGIKLVFCIIFFSLMLSFISQKSLYAGIITSASIYIFLVTIEIAVLFLLMMVFQTDMESIINTLPTRILCGAISKGLELLLAILLVRSGIKIKKLNEFKKPNTLFQLLALQTLMIVILILCVSYVSAYRTSTILYNIFITVIYLLFLILFIIDYKERERLAAIQSRFKVQDEYIKNMESILTIIRREKHDFSNHLTTILAMCTLNKPDATLKIGNYIRKLSVKLISEYHFFNSGNEYVDGMLAVKSNYAFEHGITLEADFNVPLKDVNISDCDITSIIGNIIDNAIEAIIHTGNSEGKTVSIATSGDALFHYLSISNNGPVISEKDISKIFFSGYSTKSLDKSDHGFGLYIVQQLVQRHNGIITVTSSGEKTEFLIRFIKDGAASETVS